MSEFLKEHIPAIITGLLGLGAWINEKRKKKAEVQEAESSALKTMQAAYDTFAKDMKENYDELKKDYYEVRAKVTILEKEVVDWKNKYIALKSEMNSMENGVNTTPNTNPEK